MNLNLESWTAQTVPHCFEQVATQSPDRPAVVSGEAMFSYGALADATTRLASALHKAGVSRGVRVILLLPDDIPMIIGWLGVLKSGAVCVPLAPCQPEERLQAIMADADPAVLVTNGGFLSLAVRLVAEDAGIPIVNLDLLPDGSDEGLPLPVLEPGSHAYLVYTSGTTGIPKGVIQTHRNLLKNVRVYSELMGISPQDRLAALTSFSMGQGVATMFVSLLNGATLYSYDVRQTGLASLVQWLGARQITVYTSSVTLFRQFAKSVKMGTAFPHLRAIRLGTEELRIADVELFKERFPRGCVLLNCLGSTETLNYARFRIDHDTVIAGTSVPVGHPPEGTTLGIVRPDGSACATEEIGEMVVWSSYLSPGYWRDAELTARRFQGGGKDRSYRTGDMGRRLPDGSIEFAGRIDHLVKIRGNRVELGEVEHVLTAHPAITTAAVMVCQDGDAEAALVAHVMTQLPEAEVRSYLKGRLPDFMVPSAIRTMDVLPLTPSGKADREALRAQTLLSGSMEAFPEGESWNRWETAVAECWSRVLGGDAPGLNVEFMMAGGDSLKVLRLFAEIQASMGITFDLSDVSEVFTVASMARIAETRGWDPQAARGAMVLERNADWHFLTRVQAGNDAQPFVIVPGGWGDESEILLLARVVGALGTGCSIYAVRSRAADPAWGEAGRLQEHVAAVLRELRQVIADRRWILIGECVAAAVAVELASQAEVQELTPESVVMLDPYTPPRLPMMAGFSGQCVEMPEGESVQGQPQGIHAYYRVVKNSTPSRIRSDLHVILAANAKNADHAPEYWQRLTAGRLHLGVVSGTHESYLRRDGAETVALLSKVLFPKMELADNRILKNRESGAGMRG